MASPTVLVTAYAPQPFWQLPERQRDRLTTRFPQVDWIFREDGDPSAEPRLAEVEAWMGWGFPDAALMRAPRLRWMHSGSTGVRRFLTPEFRRREISLTCARGAHAPFLAEQAMTWMLDHVRLTRTLFRAQDAREWLDESAPGFVAPRTLLGRTLLIVGYGAGGRELAQRARGFGMTVWGVRRTVPRGAAEQGLDVLLPMESLDAHLPEADFVANFLPYTDATRGFFSAERLALFRPGAFFINVGRGKTVDEPALIDALQHGRLSGAGLDVFATEPLPAPSPLWSLDSVSISPHSAGVAGDVLWERIIDGFAENLVRFLDQRPLLNRVDPVAGY